MRIIWCRRSRLDVFHSVIIAHLSPGVAALPKRLPEGAGVVLPNKDVGAAAGAVNQSSEGHNI